MDRFERVTPEAYGRGVRGAQAVREIRASEDIMLISAYEEAFRLIELSIMSVQFQRPTAEGCAVLMKRLGCASRL